jgi:hypothetical protein
MIALPHVLALLFIHARLCRPLPRALNVRLGTRARSDWYVFSSFLFSFSIIFLQVSASDDH